MPDLHSRLLQMQPCTALVHWRQSATEEVFEIIGENAIGAYKTNFLCYKKYSKKCDGYDLPPAAGSTLRV